MFANSRCYAFLFCLENCTVGVSVIYYGFISCELFVSKIFLQNYQYY